MPNNISIDALVKRFDPIKSNRSNWDTLWQESYEFCRPQLAIVTETRSPGEKLKTDIYDSTAIQSAQIFASGLHSYLTNPSSKWFALRIKDKEFKDDFEVKGWLRECEDTIFDYLNSSNFNQVIDEDYIDFGIAGTSTLYEEEDPEDEIVFSVRPPKEIYILVNDKGRIDTVYRSFNFTARQAYQKWGKDAGKKVLDLIEANKVEEPVNFLHIVLPRDERNAGKKDARNMPHASLYVEPSTKKILSEGGYQEFPFFVGRCYKASDSEYAYSPAAVALSDVKMLNTMSRDILEAAQKTLNPPVILPHDGYLLPFKTGPKAINYRLSDNADDRVETLQINREIGLSLEMENQRRTMIRQAFFVDLFLMLGNLPDRDRTATEIAERVNERMLILGPVLGRLMHEKLDPIISRTFNILMRNRRLPPPPPQVAGKDYKIEYISPLAKAQRASEIKSYNDLIVATQGLMQVDPSVVDVIDSDKIIKHIADIGNTTEVLRSDDDVRSIRDQRAQANAAREIVEQAPNATGALKTLEETTQMMKGGVKSGTGAGK